MLGRSPVMQEVFSLIQRLAPHAKVVLISGETGTGKELAARALSPGRHRGAASRSSRSTARRSSTRCSRASCSATSAARSPARSNRRPGVFETAQRRHAVPRRGRRAAAVGPGKLLRALEYGEVQRVGSLQPKRVDVTVIAATNRDLRAEVAAGRFRGDLFYRLNVVEVTLPPLRDRREDIPYLTAAFMRDVRGADAQADHRPDAGRRARCCSTRAGKATSAS